MSAHAGRALLVASAGGHIDELVRLHPRLTPRIEQPLWLTSETAQTRSLLSGRDVVWVDHIGPRDLGPVIRAVAPAARLLKDQRIARLITTGAALALPYVIAARALRIPVTYLESATRLQRPSMTGRLVRAIPGVICCCQAQQPLGRGWQVVGSVFDGFRPDSVPGGGIRKIVVSLGGEKFSFRRAVEHLQSIIPDDVEVLWQTGSTPVDDLPIHAEAWVERDRLARAMRDADAVVVHAGVGSALAALDAGRIPVLLVRRARFDEHVDDHQREIADELERRALAVAVGVTDISWGDIVRASQESVRHVDAVSPIVYSA